MRAYQSRADGETLQSTSPTKSSAERCAAAAKSAREMVGAREPFAGLGEPADILQMVLDRRVADANRRRVRLAAANQALHEFLADEVARHFLGEFPVEPGDQPPHLDPLGEACGRAAACPDRPPRDIRRSRPNPARRGRYPRPASGRCRRDSAPDIRAAAPIPSRAAARTAAAFRRAPGGPCGRTARAGGGRGSASRVLSHRDRVCANPHRARRADREVFASSGAQRLLRRLGQRHRQVFDVLLAARPARNAAARGPNRAAAARRSGWTSPPHAPSPDRAAACSQCGCATRCQISVSGLTRIANRSSGS